MFLLNQTTGEVTLDTYVRRLRPTRLTSLSAIVVLQLEILLVLGYIMIRDVRITEPLILVYPFLWTNVSLWALLTTTADSSSRRYRHLPTAVGVGYFLILAYFGGLLGFGTDVRMIPLHIDWTLPPGYSPVLLYHDSLLRYRFLRTCPDVRTFDTRVPLCNHPPLLATVSVTSSVP